MREILSADPFLAFIPKAYGGRGATESEGIDRIQITRLIGGGGVPFLGSDNLKKIIIPVPPPDKQKEIANHITDIRNKAQQLKENTTELLKKASEEIEYILIG